MCSVLLVVCQFSFDVRCVLLVGCCLLPVVWVFVVCLLPVVLVIVCWLLMCVRRFWSLSFVGSVVVCCWLLVRC